MSEQPSLLSTFRILYSRADNEIKTGQPNIALSFIRKAYKLKKLGNAEKLELQILELSCLSKTDKIEKAESIAIKIELALSKQQKVKVYRLLGGYYATSCEKPDIIKAFYYLEKSVELDQSINNSHSLIWLISLYYTQYNIQSAEALWPKVSKWQDFYERIAMDRLRITFRLGLQILVHDTLNFLMANHINLSASNYSIFIGFLISAKRKVDANKMLLIHKDGFSYTKYQSDLQARLLFEAKQYKTCVEFLEEHKENSAYSMHLLAQCNDKLGKYEDAYLHYNNTAKASLNLNSKKNDWQNTVKEYRKINLKKYLQRYSEVSEVKALEMEPSSEYCFMVGFPRSGTTLLETILDSQPSIQCMSELGFMNPVTTKYRILTGRKYPLFLDKLKESHRQELKATYNTVITNVLQSESIYSATKKTGNTPKLLIDKLPLNSIHLPLINLLFPFAKIIFSVRHPLDVVLSNFQQYFDINQEMHYLITLEGCVNRYIEVMDHINLFEKQLEQDIHYVKYEELVADLDHEVVRLSKFLKMDFSPEYKDFHKQASAKFISTPSSSQVIQPLYNSSVFKWQNYEKQLAPYFKALQPYITKFGYTL